MNKIDINVTRKVGVGTDWPVVDAIGKWLVANVGGEYSIVTEPYFKKVERNNVNGKPPVNHITNPLTMEQVTHKEVEWTKQSDEWSMAIHEDFWAIKRQHSTTYKSNTIVEVYIVDSTAAIAFKLAEPWKVNE